MEIMLPVARLVSGSVEKLFPKTKQDGSPDIGTDGKPKMTINFGIAIPKTQADWRNEAWGRQIFEIGKTAAPTMHLSPAFAWKVDDGDDKMPNRRGKINAERTGFAGNWIVWFQQSWAPKLVNADGTVELPTGSIVPGYYVQVYVSAAYNNADVSKGHTPGIYMNPIAVSLQGVGEKIAMDVDTTKLGFGGTPLPPGAQPVPTVVEGAAFGAAPSAGAPTPAPAAAPIAPNAAFMQPPAAPNAAFMQPPAAPVALAPASPVMTAKANGATYEQFKAQGWTDDQMRAQGYLV